MCDHADYDDYFERCGFCGMTNEQIHKTECIIEGFSITEDGVCSRCGTVIE